jgi:hypothetical protein
MRDVTGELLNLFAIEHSRLRRHNVLEFVALCGRARGSYALYALFALASHALNLLAVEYALTCGRDDDVKLPALRHRAGGSFAALKDPSDNGCGDWLLHRSMTPCCTR